MSEKLAPGEAPEEVDYQTAREIARRYIYRTRLATMAMSSVEEGVIGVGVGPFGRITFFALDEEAGRRVAEDEEGFSKDQYELVVTGPIINAPLHVAERLGLSTRMKCAWRNRRYRPVVVGCGAMGVLRDGSPLYGKPSGCTIGAIVERGGEALLISNNHCIHGSICGVGPAKHVVQPDDACGGKYPRDVVGEVAGAAVYDRVWRVDAAYAVATVPVRRLGLYGEGRLVRVGRPGWPRVGDRVRKFGRGLTTYSTRVGTVVALEVAGSAYCPNGVKIRYAGAVAMTRMISPGDSGSGSYTRDGRWVLLNFAGSENVSMGFPAPRVLRELGIIGRSEEEAPEIEVAIPAVTSIAGLATLKLIL